ncbi:unnamed protein product [Moneuplotes crassus]|uniref:Uncharacterized protein n=1 Tax=Euplotes crassus TaxID=5936 RepID=A0AAD1Y0Z7_EUPCR|nr:unnamed protein product [Moneuplotes crassus]
MENLIFLLLFLLLANSAAQVCTIAGYSIPNADCIECSSGGYFNLQTLRCVGTCPTGTTPIAKAAGYVIEVLSTTNNNGVLSTTPQESYSISVCKQDTIYINYYSSSNIELGTAQYPYRFLDHAIYDAFNYPNSFTINIIFLITGSYNYDIDHPLLIRNSQINFSIQGSGSSVQINLYPSAMKSKVLTAEGTSFRIRGPESYASIDFETDSPYINLKNSQVTMTNLVMIAGNTNLDIYSM